jgi:hypothetical protein
VRETTVSFGKYKGWAWVDVPDDYLEYLIEMKEEQIQEYRDELTRRQLLQEAELPMAEQIIRAGYHALAQKHHPDKGGDETKMRELNASHEGLKELLSMQQTTP